VCLTAEWDEAALQALEADDTEPNPAWPALDPLPPKGRDALGAAPPELREEWLAMQDTHEFFGVLKRHRVERLPALRDVGPDLAQRVPTDMAERVLNDVAERDIPFMCFVGNHGMVQIHSGPDRKSVV